MAETKRITVKTRISHQMVRVRAGWVDSLTGEEWDILECPECGYLQRIQWQPWKSETLRLGEGMITDEMANEILALCKSGPEGRLKAKQLMARAPGHSYVQVPSEDQLRQIARDMDQEAEFDKALEAAILEGRPLFTFGMGGAEASTWPKGGGPPKGEVS